jgi:hypothetical protein
VLKPSKNTSNAGKTALLAFEREEKVRKRHIHASQVAKNHWKVMRHCRRLLVNRKTSYSSIFRLNAMTTSTNQQLIPQLLGEC